MEAAERKNHVTEHFPRYYAALAAAIFVFSWAPRLSYGFWVDETATYWTACQGWRLAWERTIGFPGQSVLYALIESLLVVEGPYREVLMRIPSVIAAAAAAWFLYRLAETLIGPGVGWLAVIPFLCEPTLATQATEARPYALALAFALATFYTLMRWLGTASSKWWWLYVLTGALTLQFHYFFGFVFLVHCAWLLYRPTAARVWLHVAAAWLLIGLSLLPLAEHVLALRRAPHTIVDGALPPKFTDLLQVWFPPDILLPTGLGLLLIWLIARGWPMTESFHMEPEKVFLLVVWWLTAPMVFFLIGRLWTGTLFSPRYVLFTYPAFCLLFAFLVSRLRALSLRFLLVLAVFAGAVLNPGVLLEVSRGGRLSWREPLASLKQIAGSENVPVFVQSGFFESVYQDWKGGVTPTNHLFAGVLAYPIRNPILPLPFLETGEAQAFVDEALAGRLRDERRFCLVAADGTELPRWLCAHLTARGFRYRTYLFNRMSVTLFERRG